MAQSKLVELQERFDSLSSENASQVQERQALFVEIGERSDERGKRTVRICDCGSIAGLMSS